MPWKKWRCVLAVDSEGVYLMPQLMIYRVWCCLDYSRRSTPWEMLARSVSRGMAVVEMLVCSIWTNTTDLFVVPRLSSLVLGSFYRRTLPLFSFERYPNHFSPWFVRSLFIVFYVILCVSQCGLPLPLRGQINNQSSKCVCVCRCQKCPMEQRTSICLHCTSPCNY